MDEIWPTTLPDVPPGEVREYVLLLTNGQPCVLDSWHYCGTHIRHVDRWTADLGWVVLWEDYPEVVGWDSAERRTLSAIEAQVHVDAQLGPTAAALARGFLIRQCGHYYDDERGPRARSSDRP